MAATVIDALMVTLGLDAKGFITGKNQATDATKKLSAEEAKAGKELEERNKRATESFRKVRNEVLALLAVFTAGLGLKDFATNTITSAVNLGYMAKNLNMSAQDLQAWQRAAERAGSSAGGITSALQDSQQQIAKFRLGQGSDSVQTFLRWGGKVSDLKDGNTYLLARARIIHAMFQTDPGRAQLIAQQMGIGPDAFNFLNQSTDAILALVNAQRHNSALTEAQIKRLQVLNNEWLDFRDRLNYVSTSILVQLIPVFESVMGYFQRMADWVADHKGDIGDWLAGAVKNVQQFAEWANNAADAVGGWQDVLIALGTLKILSMVSPLLSLASALGSVGSALGLIGGGAGAAALTVLGGVAAAAYSQNLNSGEDDYLKQRAAKPGQAYPGDAVGDARRSANTGSLAQRQQYLLGRLKSAGFSDAQAAGIIGSLMQEDTGLNPAAVNSKSGAAGIGQWLGSRAKQFQSMFGHSVAQGTFGEQVDFMLQELKTTERTADQRIRMAQTPAQAAEIHAREYERPGSAEANIARRQAYAASVYGSIGQLNAAQIAGQSAGARGAGASGARVSSMTSSAETNINGPITIQTQATDAQGIAREFGKAVSKYSFTVPQANTGLT